MLAYCHIPKTAGTTLNYILRKNFGNKLLATIERKGNNYTHRDLKLDSLIYKDIKCISGHGLKPFIDYKEFNGEMKWFTFVRDPIKRFVSQYIHQNTNGLDKNNLTIEAWAEKFHRSNWLVKWIAGEENLEKAIHIIEEKFIFIGLVEDFDSSLNLMKKSFSLDLNLDFGKSKMIVRDKSLKKELLIDRYNELLPFYKRQNNLDIQFYDYIKNNFIPRLKEQVSNNSVYNKPDNFKIIDGYYSFKIMQNFIYKPYVFLTKNKL